MDPATVFKIRAGSRPTESGFEGRGLQILGETVDYTYFVLADDDGADMTRDIGRYAVTGAQKSFFDLVNGIEPYGPEDRSGPGLPADMNFVGSMVLDVGLWPSNDNEQAFARASILDTVLEQAGAQVILRSVSARRTYLRVEVSAQGLQDLLETSVVEQVRTPPVPFLDFQDWWNLAPDDISRRELAGGSVGVLDDSPAGAHPLLSGLVLSDEALAPVSYQWQVRGDHGTEVVGRVLYPRLHDELRDLDPLTAVGTVRVVRILEPDPSVPGTTRFAQYDFPHEIVDQGIRHLATEHGVKVFNLSVGYADPFSDIHVGALTEVIDDLARELDVVIVVPTGNAPATIHGRTASGHHILHDRPEHFFTPEHRMSEPGPAALALTVGSIALSGAPAEMPGRAGWVAVASENEVSPFSRSGPGLGTAKARINKPELVHFGGNVVINDLGQALMNDPGAGIVTTSTRGGTGALFGSVNGTSYAAPAVARVAADVAEAYPDASANLIRALVGSSARRPIHAVSIPEPHKQFALYGYGVPSTERAIDSDSRRTTLTFDGSMPIDTVQIHPLPVPEAFRRGSGGQRTISVALAFDPPVRRQRREYLAASMKIDIYRDIDLGELTEILRKQDPDNPADMVTGRRRLSLGPGSNSFTNSTLQVRSWSARNSFINDEAIFYVVVTHKAQVWSRTNTEYQAQTYGLAVTLEDQNMVREDLYQLLTQQVNVAARVRVRA